MAGEGFPTENTRVVPAEVPEPVSAAQSDKWWESPVLKPYESDPTIRKARAVQEAARKTTQDAYKGMANRNPYVTEAQHLKTWMDTADKGRKKVNEKLQEFQQEAAADLQAIKETADYQLGLKETPRSAEIRQYLRSITAEERAQFMSEAVNKGDSESAAAVLNGPAYLAGLDDDMQHNFRERYVRTHAPELIQRRDAVSRSKQIAADAATYTTDYIVDLTPREKIQKAEDQHQAFVATVESDEDRRAE